MPHTVRKGKGKKPWKIVNKDTGETKGSSETKKKAQASAHRSWAFGISLRLIPKDARARTAREHEE